MPATGAAGLAALAAKPAGTMTIAFGSLSPTERRFTAEIVHAGDSVSGERLDAVHGNVVARSGDQLTVKGAFAVRSNHVARLHRTVLVNVGASTKVLKTGAVGAVLDASALSVGQHIVAFGALTEPATDATPATFDATNGRVRMLPTHLHGAVNSVVPGQLNLNLRGIDRLGIDLFDFAGTGTTAGQDANPADYEVATGTLGLASVAAGEAVRVLGFVRPFGSAPADFEGRTVVDYREPPALLGIGWGSTRHDGTVLVHECDRPRARHRQSEHRRAPRADRRHAVRRLADACRRRRRSRRRPRAARVYGISVGGDIRLFTSFAEFSTELALALSGGHAALALTASGSYDSATATLHATHIAVHFAGG